MTLIIYTSIKILLFRWKIRTYLSNIPINFSQACYEIQCYPEWEPITLLYFLSFLNNNLLKSRLEWERISYLKYLFWVIFINHDKDHLTRGPTFLKQKYISIMDPFSLKYEKTWKKQKHSVKQQMLLNISISVKSNILHFTYNTYLNGLNNENK